MEFEPEDPYAEFYDTDDRGLYVGLEADGNARAFYWEDTIIRQFPTGVIDHIEVHNADNTVTAAYAPEDIIASMIRHGWRHCYQSWIPEKELLLASEYFVQEVESVLGYCE